MACSLETEQCGRLETLYRGHCFDPQQLFMKYSALKSMDELMSILVRNTAVCVSNKANAEKTLECVRLRAEGQSYLLNCSHAREDFLKKCAPSVLLRASRSSNCRKFDRAHQKALQVYRVLWFHCVQKTSDFYQNMRFVKLPSKPDQNVVKMWNEIHILYEETMEIFESEMVKILANLHPNSSPLISTDPVVEDLPDLEDNDEGDNAGVPSSPMPKKLSTNLIPGIRMEFFIFAMMFRNCSAYAPWFFTALNTGYFLESNDIRPIVRHLGYTHVLSTVKENMLFDSFFRLPSSRILLVQLLAGDAFFRDEDYREISMDNVSRNLESLLNYPDLISYFSRSENKFTLRGTDTYGVQATTVAQMLVADQRHKDRISFLAGKILSANHTHRQQWHYQYYEVRNTQRWGREKALALQKAFPFKQVGNSIFQLRSDLKRDNRQLESEQFWVTSSGEVMSLLRGDLTVSDDGDVTIKCSNKPNRGIWHHIFIPGLNDSYIDPASRPCPTGNDEIMALVLVKNCDLVINFREGGIKTVRSPPSYVLTETWTVMKDVQLLNM